jgi:acetyl esterase/lipase
MSTREFEITYKTVEINEWAIDLVIVKPATAQSTHLPAFMFFHGGGWVSGDFQSHQQFVLSLVKDSGVAAVFVEYPLAPRVQFPVTMHQAYLATQWVSQHGHEIGVDGSRLGVVGNSSGGNLAAAVCLMANEKKNPIIQCQILFYPALDAHFDTESYQKYAQGYMLTRSAMERNWSYYVPNEKDRQTIYASPFRATVENLKGLPPTLIETAEFDVLRDEAEQYHQKLKDAGVHSSLKRYNGVGHAFIMVEIYSQPQIVSAALEEASNFLKDHL